MGACFATGDEFACKTGATLHVYDAKYNDVTDDAGKRTLTITDASFGSGTLESWHSPGGGYFEITATSAVVASNSKGEPVIVRDLYGAGRVILTSMDLELQGDSELDWTIWDNWEMGSHTHSEKNWELLGRIYSRRSADPSSFPGTCRSRSACRMSTAVF